MGSDRSFRVLNRLWPCLAMVLVSCTGPERSADQAWGNAVVAPGAFFAAPGGESLSLPASTAELDAYIARTGAISDRRGAGHLLSAPLPLPRSVCKPASEAVVFSYPLQPDGFMPSYTAYIDNGLVVCIDRTFAYASR